jgi:hypothetical protein
MEARIGVKVSAAATPEVPGAQLPGAQLPGAQLPVIRIRPAIRCCPEIAVLAESPTSFIPSFGVSFAVRAVKQRVRTGPGTQRKGGWRPNRVEDSHP